MRGSWGDKRRHILPVGLVLAAALGTALLSLVAVGSSPALAVATPPSRWIDVSVATLWVRPGIARPVDTPACGNPARPRQWIAGMTLDQKRWLVGRLETQALYGTKVYVLGTSGSWSKVAVTGQPTPRNTLGYPGWLPTVQLTREAPAATSRIAVVRQKAVWLWLRSDLTGRVFEVSYGTRLRALSWTPTSVQVVLLDGRRVYVRRSVVALQERGTPWPAPAGSRLVEQARRFLAVQYLWAGTSGFGPDCSGLTWAVHAALGKTIPRDAAPQSARGARIATRAALRPGDLVFFRSASGTIHHVGMYIGGGRMIHAPRTGSPVATVSIYAEPYFSEFAGGRRYWTP